MVLPVPDEPARGRKPVSRDGSAAVVDRKRDAAKTVRIDGLAALVGSMAPGAGADLVLHSDVELYARIELGSKVTGAIPMEPIPTSLRNAALHRLIGEHVIAREAKRVRIGKPRSSDISRERHRLEFEAGGRNRLRDLLRKLSVSKREIKPILLRRALVTAFLQANLAEPRSLARTETEPSGEVRTPVAAADNLSAAAQMPDATAIHPDETRESFDNVQTDDARERAIARWVSVLRTRIPIRVFGDYAPL